MIDLMQFWFKKNDFEAVVGAIDIISKRMRGFEYTLSMADGKAVVAMSFSLGKKATLFGSTLWIEVITIAMGVAPEVELSESVVTFRIRTSPKGAGGRDTQVEPTLQKRNS